MDRKTEYIVNDIIKAMAVIIFVVLLINVVIIVGISIYNDAKYPQCYNLDRFQEERCHEYIDAAKLKANNLTNSTNITNSRSLSMNDGTIVDYYSNPGYRHMPGNYWNNINRGAGIGYP